jgi:DNA-binding LacI/PurR family transcriptional regulator
MGKSVPKYVYVEDKIKQAIKKGEIVNKLPGERLLAKEFGFSYMTIRKAVDNLVAAGILYRIPMKGTFVADKKTSRKKTLNIGYFLDSTIKDGLTSPYYSLIFNALEKEAANNGYSLIYFSDINKANVKVKVRQIDGVIASCFPRIEHIIKQINKIVPVVVIDNSHSDKTIPSVIIDNFNAVVDSMDYLYSIGHNRIGFMTGLEDSDVGKNRYMGYKSALNNHGLDESEDLVFKGNYSFKSGIEGANYFLSLDKPPTAIMCANDSMAIGVMKKISETGLNVPDDISVIGFDDINMAAQIIPPLTTVSAPIKMIAKQSFIMLNSLIRGEKLDNRHVALPAQLVIRRSCAQRKKTTTAA